MRRKTVSGIMLTLLMASILIVLTSPIPVIAQSNSATTVYLDPPTINGTEIGVDNTVTVSIMIRDAHNVYAWQAGLTFNADLLECTGLFPGNFLSNIGDTFWIPGIVNNTAGMIFPPSMCALLGEVSGANGSGRLAYVTFKIKTPGVSDIHLSNVKVLDTNLDLVPVNVIDVYTVVVDTTAHTIVIVSNSTGSIPKSPGSGFYDHAFSILAEKISFKVTGRHPGFSNVTIPKTLLSVSTLDEWRVAMDGILLSTGERIITENDTHTSIYFTYSAGFHYVQITTRPLITSVISITLSSTFVIPGSNITISGDIDPVRPNVKVTILYEEKIFGWTTLATLTTDSNSHYSYTWTPKTVGTYEFMAMWEGDDNTFGDLSDVKTLYAGVIYVRADGIVDPPDAPISSVDNVTYTFTDNINGSIVVERDNILVDGAGYILQGMGSGEGVYLSYRSNVTIKNMEIKTFELGIYLYSSYNNSISGNNITNNDYGIWLSYSSNNTISGNTITANNRRGIWLSESSNNTISGNNITNNDDGIFLSSSSNNTISGNNITNNGRCGIYLVYPSYSSNNNIYHNNFINNTYQVVTRDGYMNVWDNGYPSGGNFWSDYTGVDVKNGPYQNETESDGIGDTPYVIDGNNQDNYPLMYPWGAPSPPSYTLTIHSSPTGVTFTVDGVSRTTPWSGTYSEGASLSLVMPESHDGYEWSHWDEDGDPNRIKTVTLDTNITLTAVYTPPKPVGGKATPINIPINKPETPTLWIWLSTIILSLIVTVVYVKKRKRH